MSQHDAQGEARDALGTAVSGYGQRVRRPAYPRQPGHRPAPDLPRERSLLVTGAEAGIAAEMTQHVQEQHIDPDTAVQLVARPCPSAGGPTRRPACGWPPSMPRPLVTGSGRTPRPSSPISRK